MARTLKTALYAALAAWSAACAGARGATSPLQCPPEPQPPRLVPLLAVDSTIRQDIRYASANNFTGAPLPGYELGAALLRPDAAAALARVQERLRPRGLRLKVFDAYRPVRATLAMVAWAERSGNAWVLEQGYVARRSNHNRGNTVDLTLVRVDTGEELSMGTPFDHFGPESHTLDAEGPVLRNRRILLDAMEAEGWRNYEKEWWHYSYPGEYTALDVPIACFVGMGL